MLINRLALALSATTFFWASDPAVPSHGGSQPSASESEQTLWNLEHAYWRYVQQNDLTAYRALWHKNFLGWPSVSASPVRKDHITDWITSQTAKGLGFKIVDFKPAALQVTGSVGVACYWITYQWLGQDGKGTPAATFRIEHAWVKYGKDWQIIGGMSMPGDPPSPK